MVRAYTNCSYKLRQTNTLIDMKKKSDELLVQDCERKIRSQTKSRKNGIVFFSLLIYMRLKKNSTLKCSQHASMVQPFFIHKPYFRLGRSINRCASAFFTVQEIASFHAIHLVIYENVHGAAVRIGFRLCDGWVIIIETRGADVE